MVSLKDGGHPVFFASTLERWRNFMKQSRTYLAALALVLVALASCSKTNPATKTFSADMLQGNWRLVEKSRVGSSMAPTAIEANSSVVYRFSKTQFETVPLSRKGPDANGPNPFEIENDNLLVHYNSQVASPLEISKWKIVSLEGQKLVLQKEYTIDSNAQDKFQVTLTFVKMDDSAVAKLVADSAEYWEKNEGAPAAVRPADAPPELPEPVAKAEEPSKPVPAGFIGAPRVSELFHGFGCPFGCAVCLLRQKERDHKSDARHPLGSHV
jgi:hypothetical protein